VACHAQASKSTMGVPYSFASLEVNLGLLPRLTRRSKNISKLPEPFRLPIPH
jgi:hypothetical protein